MMEDFAFNLFSLAVGLLLLAAAMFLVGAAVDLVFFDRAAFPQITACQTTRGVPRRQTFSVRVVCVPANTRQDTTTINLKTAP